MITLSTFDHKNNKLSHPNQQEEIAKESLPTNGQTDRGCHTATTGTTEPSATLATTSVKGLTSQPFPTPTAASFTTPQPSPCKTPSQTYRFGPTTLCSSQAKAPHFTRHRFPTSTTNGRPT